MKLPHDLSGIQVARALCRVGFEVVRQKGSHARLVRGSRKVTIPMHHSIAVGTLSSILDQSGISIEDFLENL